MLFVFDFNLVPDFDLASWIGCGRRWPRSSKRPKPLNDAFKALIRYPDVYASFPPECDLNIIEFLALDLPHVSTSLSVNFLDNLFSYEPESAGVLPILDIEMPSGDVLHKLREMLPQKWLDGYRSLRGIFPNHNLPFHILTLWIDLLPAVVTQPRWMRAYAWFHNCALPLPIPDYLSHIPNAIETFFEVMGWDVHVCGLSSMKSTDLIELFGRGMLSGKVIEGGMLMLRDWASKEPGLRSIQIETFDFQYPFTVNDIDWATFEDHHSQFGYLRTIAQAIRTSQITKVVAPLHLPGVDHFSATSVDFVKLSIHYGDGLDFSMPQRDLDGILRLGEKAGKPISSQWQKIAPRPIQDDGFSCGIIALNICEREIWPRTRLWESSTKDFERIEYALLLATGPGSTYSLVCQSSCSAAIHTTK